MDDKLILKILKGIASEDEKKEFFSRCSIDEELKNEYIKYKNLWTLSLDEKHENKEQQFDLFWQEARRKDNKSIKKLVVGLSRYAAVILVTFGIAYLINSNIKQNESGDLVHVFSSEMGSVSSIELKDGSKIWLNSGSELIFTEKTEKRIIAQLSGEAYFEIEHNENREFIVEAGKLRIKDLGTKFDIKAYPARNWIQTTLIEGKIEIQKVNGQSKIEMNPNDHFSYNKKTNKYQLSTRDGELVAAWKDGKFVFIDMKLRGICDELERWYNVNIEIVNNPMASEKYTSVIKRTTTIDQMLEMLKYNAGIDYEILKNENGIDEIKIY